MRFDARSLLLIPFLAIAGAAQAQTSVPIELVPNFTGAVGWKSAFSPDGKYVVRGGLSGGDVSVWEISSGRKIRSFKGFAKAISAVAFSPDGARIAAASSDETRSGGRTGAGAGDSLRIWDVRTGKNLIAIKAHNLTVKSLAFSRDGSKLLSGGGTYRGDKELAKSSNAFDSPLKLWDSRTGRVIKVFDGHTDDVVSAVFSKDETAILSSSEDKTIKLWDASSGRLVRTFTGFDKELKSARFLPDGKTILAEIKYNTARILELSSGRLLRTISGGEYGSLALMPDGKTVIWPPPVSKSGEQPGKLYDLESGKIVGELKLPLDGWMYSETDLIASPDGKLLLARHDRVIDAATGKLVTQLGNRIQQQNSIHVTPDGSKIVVGGNAVTLWDMVSGQLAHSYEESTDREFTGSVSIDGTRVISIESYAKVKSRDITTGRVEFELDVPSLINNPDISKYPFWTKLSPDHKTIAVAGIDKTIRLFDTATGKLLHSLGGHKESVSVAFSPDGARVLTMSSREDVAKLWSVQTGALLRSHSLRRDEGKSSEHELGIANPSFSPDGKFVVGSAGRRLPDLFMYTATAWNPDTGQFIRHFGADPHAVTKASLSADGNHLIGRTSDRTLRIWDVRTGQLVRSFGSHTDNINDVKISPDGRRAFSSSQDGTLKIWSVETGELLATLIKGQEGAWLVLTPEGFFNASPNAAGLLSIVQGMETYSIDQVYQSLFRPDLVREKLAGDPRGLVREAAAQLDLGRVIGSGNVPGVAMVSPQDGVQVTGGQITAEVDVTDRGGGVGRIEWRLNGVTVGIETPPAPAAGQTLRLTRGLSLDPGSNTIEVVSFNGANLVASVPVRASVTAPAAPVAPAAPGQVAAPQQSRLFVIAAGLDDYTDSRFKLGGSVRDAQALTNAFAATGNGLYKTVDVKLLTDADVTKDKLDAAFKEFAAQASPSDVFLLYLAGHGKTVNGRYYFIPREFNVGANADEKAINAAVVTQGIAQEQWQRWFASIPARKSVILFDTCESGTLTGAAASTKTLEQSAANDRLAQATGRTIITASSGSEVAFEGYRGHGLFTYNLLDGLERADSDGNGTIEITELATFVYSQVTTLSEQVFKKRQEPQIRIASSYPLAKQGRVLAGDLPVLTQDASPAFQLAQTADLQIKPGNGATVVRSLNAKTSVTVIKSEGGWSLIASNGKPLGYVATKDLAPVR